MTCERLARAAPPPRTPFDARCCRPGLTKRCFRNRFLLCGALNRGDLTIARERPLVECSFRSRRRNPSLATVPSGRGGRSKSCCVQSPISKASSPARLRGRGGFSIQSFTCGPTFESVRPRFAAGCAEALPRAALTGADAAVVCTATAKVFASRNSDSYAYGFAGSIRACSDRPAVPCCECRNCAWPRREPPASGS